MPFIETDFPGLLIFEPRVFEDERGYFFESYNKALFVEAGIPTEFVQDNQSKSRYGVLRGLHYQREPFAQAKLVRVVQGKVLDVAVDIRRGSPTYGRYMAVELSGTNFRQLLVPTGFAHGFAVLSDEVVLAYKCDNFYSREHDAGIAYDDPDLNIDWQLPANDIILSEKDQDLPRLKDAPNNFEFNQSS